MNESVKWNVIRVLNVDLKCICDFFAAFLRDLDVSLWHLQFMVLALLRSESHNFFKLVLLTFCMPSNRVVSV